MVFEKIIQRNGTNDSVPQVQQIHLKPNNKMKLILIISLLAFLCIPSPAKIRDTMAISIKRWNKPWMPVPTKENGMSQYTFKSRNLYITQLCFNGKCVRSKYSKIANPYDKKITVDEM